MTDLDRLIEAVEAGKWDIWPAWKALTITENGMAERAFNGSLDAAKALNDALLPGQPAIIETEGVAQVSWAKNNWRELSDADIPGNPARAWLLAILKAYRAQVQK